MRPSEREQPLEPSAPSVHPERPQPAEVLDAIEADARHEPEKYGKGAIVEHGGE